MFKFWKNSRRKDEDAFEISESQVGIPFSIEKYGDQMATPNSIESTILFNQMIISSFVRYDNEFVVVMKPCVKSEAAPSGEIILTFGWLMDPTEGKNYADLTMFTFDHWLSNQTVINFYAAQGKLPTLVDHDNRWIPLPIMQLI